MVRETSGVNSYLSPEFSPFLTHPHSDRTNSRQVIAGSPGQGLLGPSSSHTPRLSYYHTPTVRHKLVLVSLRAATASFCGLGCPLCRPHPVDQRSRPAQLSTAARAGRAVRAEIARDVLRAGGSRGESTAASRCGWGDMVGLRHRLAARWRHRQSKDEDMSRIRDGDKLAQDSRRVVQNPPHSKHRLL